MKKLIISLIGAALMVGAAFALDLGPGKTTGGVYNITNATPGATMGGVLITYDAALTAANTMTFDVVCADSVVYRLGSTTSASNAVYDSVTNLIAWPLKVGELWRITTTQTNVNLNILGI